MGWGEEAPADSALFVEGRVLLDQPAELGWNKEVTTPLKANHIQVTGLLG